ncbi:MAG: toxin-antitoxin system HicB family antitoxin [Ktedonobacteraceae bacterium]|nr:toxin-antitoxin system HicB family antitoxin [Ktedonobacteraceae bacterium]
MSQEYKRQQSFPLRLSPSTRLRANELAHAEGVSMNHFICLAVAEKVSRMEQASLNHEQMGNQQINLLASHFSIKKHA